MSTTPFSVLQQYHQVTNMIRLHSGHISSQYSKMYMLSTLKSTRCIFGQMVPPLNTEKGKIFPVSKAIWRILPLHHGLYMEPL